MPTFINGKIFTGIDQTTFVSAMTIEDGHVTWIGESDEINDSETIDLHGKTVLPGLIDVHTHPKYIADALHGVACTPPNVNSIKRHASCPTSITGLWKRPRHLDRGLGL